ncbi:hypothetical protein Tco_0916902, partial [Tanacetum coccineum]
VWHKAFGNVWDWFPGNGKLNKLNEEAGVLEIRRQAGPFGTAARQLILEVSWTFGGVLGAAEKLQLLGAELEGADEYVGKIALTVGDKVAAY